MSAAAAGTVDGFRAAMRRVAATVNIVTSASVEGEWAGMTATAMSSVSFDPPSLLICVHRETLFHPVLIERRAFCINVLSSGQSELSRLFSSRNVREGRFSQGEWREGALKLPYLVGCCANIFCEVAELMEFGSHTIAVAHVIDAQAYDNEKPLIYLNGTYHE